MTEMDALIAAGFCALAVTLIIGCIFHAWTEPE